MAGDKHDTGKAPFDLISPIALAFLAQVLAFGAQKYAAHNWRKGIPQSKLIAASHRHLAAIQAGINYDAETGLPHAAHLMCEAMFMCEQLTTTKGNDIYHLNTNQKNLLDALLAGDVNAVTEQLNAIHSIS